MVDRAVEFATQFKGFADALLLDISDKTVVVPDNDYTRQFASNAKLLVMSMSAQPAGFDIGVDTSLSS